MLFQDLLQDAEKPTERLFSCFAYDSGGEGFPNHCHLHLEMLFQSVGSNSITMNGHTRVLRTGDLAFIPMLVPHAIGVTSEPGSAHIVLQISPNYVSFGTSNADLVRRIQRGPALEDGVACQLPEGGKVRLLLEELARECRAGADGSLSVRSRNLGDTQSYAALCRINGLIFQAMSELFAGGVLRISDDAGGAVNMHELARLAPVLGRMVTNPEQRFSLEDAAQMTSMSYSAFSRTFSRAIGQSFVDYQNTLRIRVAEDLLRSTDESISQIADRTHFGSQSYFNRVFKQFNGVSPSAYRKGTRTKKDKLCTKLALAQSLHM